MFKNHPKGLVVAFFTNMGERFGFYTMMACLMFFLQARYGLSADKAGDYYSWFYFLIYALALLGGFIADKTQNYKGTIFVGIVTMLGGYILMSIPRLGLSVSLVALLIIALGNGLFKGNLQAVVGQLYDDPKYTPLRDSAFSIFYMGINIGAFFAPSAANGIRNWFLSTRGYIYDADLPALCNSQLAGTLADTTKLQELANKVTGTTVADLPAFVKDYIDVFSTGYNYAFGVAAAAMVISFLVYFFFGKILPNKQKAAGEKTITLKEKPWALPIALGGAAIFAFLIYLVRDFPTGLAFGLFVGFVIWIILMSSKEEKPRVSALVLVFIVVIFFWMSFHQNGLTQSLFARDYTVKEVDPFTFIFFDLKAFLSLIGAGIGLVLLLRKNSQTPQKIIGAGLIIVGGFLTYNFYSNYQALNPIEPEIFQHFNPIFIVILTPVIIGLFAYWRKRGKEPSSPRKIGIGMILAALGFVVMLVGSIHLMSPAALGGLPTSDRVSPYWLINSYLVLTVAELFLSPMGLAFVAKVAPSRFQGLMQGGWLAATAAGNKLLFVGSLMWVRVELWQLWLIFVVCCLASAAFIFSIMKRLERATQG
ncbi:peptide MFS transporter [candidate division KSB1 bacterium]|nr:peptide MFS transporter [candidate division KSB1 bacterium]